MSSITVSMAPMSWALRAASGHAHLTKVSRMPRVGAWAKTAQA